MIQITEINNNEIKLLSQFNSSRWHTTTAGTQNTEKHQISGWDKSQGGKWWWALVRSEGRPNRTAFNRKRDRKRADKKSTTDGVRATDHFRCSNNNELNEGGSSTIEFRKIASHHNISEYINKRNWKYCKRKINLKHHIRASASPCTCYTFRLFPFSFSSSSSLFRSQMKAHRSLVFLPSLSLMPFFSSSSARIFTFPLCIHRYFMRSIFPSPIHVFSSPER